MSKTTNPQASEYKSQETERGETFTATLSQESSRNQSLKFPFKNRIQSLIFSSIRGENREAKIGLERETEEECSCFGLKKKKKNKEMHTTEPSQPPAPPPAQQNHQLVLHSSGSLSFSSHMSREDEEMARSALSTFRAKEDEIEKKKMEVRDRVQAQLGRVEEETKRLAMIREELESLADPMRKEVALVRKKVDTVNKELKPLGHTVQKKEKEYKEALDAFNEKNREKVQLITKLMEMVGESEKLRLKKLEELSKSIDSIN